MSGNKRLVAHALVRNEARWIWFSLMSALDLVDEIMVWDTGSTDRTVDIIKSIPSAKIKLRRIGSVDAAGHTAARQAMLKATKADYLLILDGDEIWYRDSLSLAIATLIATPAPVAVVSPFINLVGDIYHSQLPSRSHYRIGQFHGPYNIRLMSLKIPGLHVSNPHGRQEYRDQAQVALQNYPSPRVPLVPGPYLHTTHLLRSHTPAQDKQTLKRGFKYRYELGQPLPSKFIFPEVFYYPRPEIVPNPWVHRSAGYAMISNLVEPFRFIKNLLPAPQGY